MSLVVTLVRSNPQAGEQSRSVPLDTNPRSEIPVSEAPAHFQPQTDPSASWTANAAALSATRPSPNQRCHVLLTQSRGEKKLRLKEPNKTTTHQQQGYNSSSRVSSPSWAKALLHPRSPEGSGSQLPGKEIPGALPDSSSCKRNQEHMREVLSHGTSASLKSRQHRCLPTGEPLQLWLPAPSTQQPGTAASHNLAAL